MAKKTPTDLKLFRKEMKALKKAGLIPSKVDLSTVKPTRHYKSVIRQNRDVIAGKSFVVRIWKGLGRIWNSITSSKTTRAREVASNYGSRVRVKGGKVIVEHAGSQPVRYNKKTGRLSTYTIDNRTGKRIKAELVPGKQDFQALEKRGYKFRIFFDRGRNRSPDALTFDSAAEMEAFANLYVKQGTFQNWREYVMIIKREGLSNLE